MRIAAAVILGVAFGRRATVPPQTAAPPAPAARNLLLITIDTLRADRVGAYGYRAARTPGIDALAARGVRFEHAFAPAPITLTSHATLMTGRYPPGHGAATTACAWIRRCRRSPTRSARAGFATAAFVAAFPLDRRFGLIMASRPTATACRAGPMAGRPASGPDAWS